MSKLIDLTGSAYGRLTVVSRAENTKGNRRAVWNCICECGNTTKSGGDALRIGKTNSCGCLKNELSAERIATINTTHGKCKTPEYSVWTGMLSRCRNDNEKQYHRYGGRGISVCERWLSFENFLEDMGECPKGMSIERLDNDGNYEPSNCKWVTRHEQDRNKSTNTTITYNGVTMILTDWARQIGMPVWKLSQRLHRDGLQFSEAIINDDRRYNKETA
jgi:hypothetical protein